MSDSTPEVASEILASLAERRSRRGFLKGTAAAGVALAGVTLLPTLPAAAATGDEAEDSIQTIFNVARTAEQLAVTFYSHGVDNASALGLSGVHLDNIKAALIEEQIHYYFFVANGAKSLANTFSFPHGAATFTDLSLFIQTQQQLEGVFDSAFIAAVYEFAAMGRPDLARIAAQVAMIEEGHRELGRDILADRGMSAYDPADNWAFAPQLVEAVGDAPALVAAAGYLNPKPGNSYSFHTVDLDSPTLGPIFQKVRYQSPVVAPEDSD